MVRAAFRYGILLAVACGVGTFAGLVFAQTDAGRWGIATFVAAAFVPAVAVALLLGRRPALEPEDVLARTFVVAAAGGAGMLVCLFVIVSGTH